MGSVNGVYWLRLLVHEEDVIVLTLFVRSRVAGTRFSLKYRTHLPRLSSSTIPVERSGQLATIVDVHPKQATLLFLLLPPSSVPVRSRDTLWRSALSLVGTRTCPQKRRSTSQWHNPGSASTSKAPHIRMRTQGMTRTLETSTPPLSSHTVVHHQWCPASAPHHPH